MSAPSPAGLVELTQNALNIAPLALVLVDLDGTMLLANRHASALFGYSSEELIGRSVDILVPERLRAGYPEKRRAFMSAQSELPMGVGREVIGRRRDGSEFPVELGLTPFRHGTDIFALAALIDITERLRADAAARHLANVVNSSSDAISSASFDGVIQSWNDGAARVFGYTEEEMIGRHISILIPPEKAGEEVRLFERLRDGFPCDHFETVRRRKDGKTIAISLTLSPIRDRSGGVVGVSAVARDLTAQKQLERQQQRFFDCSLELLAVAGFDGFVRKANSAMMRTLGFRESDMVAKPFFDLVHPDDLPSVRQAIEQLSNGSSMVGFEIRCRTADRSYRSLRWNIVPDAEAGIMHASARDVTEQKEQLRLLALGRDVGIALAQHSTMKHMLQSCAEPIVTHLEAACARIWTLPEESDVLELQASAGLHPPSDGRESRIPVGTFKIGAIARERRPHLINDVVNDSRVDDIEWVRREGLVAFAGHPLIVDGRLVGVVAIFARHGLSPAVVGALASIADMIAVGIDRRYADAALARSEAEAQSANRAKSEFLANMSHEIRTPMNGVLGMTHLLLDSQLTGKQREYVEMAHRSAESLLGVINDVLDFSKIEAGKLSLDMRPFNPVHVAEDAIRDVSLRAYAKHLEVTLDVASAMPELILGDPDRLRQVLMNLLGNAIKFTARGEVVLTMCTAGGSSSEAELEFSVRDTGIGIAEEHVKRIFAAFEQGDTSVARAYGGTGLGLSISARIVALMGGALKVESAVAVGSTFRFNVLFDVVQPSAVLEAGREASNLAGRRVLVVDDNATHRRSICTTLSRWAIDCQCAGGGAEALQALRAAVNEGRPFSLLLLDAMMPDVDGFWVAEATLSCRDFDGTRLLLMVPGSEPDTEAQCRSLGIRSVTKPLTPSLLFDVVTTLLTGPDLGDSNSNSVASADAAARTAALTLARSDVSTNPRPPRSLRVLLAEDNLINQKVAVAMLESAGHSVVVANNGSDAVTALRHSRFDVVLMDVQMPVMDGLQATAAMRAYEHEVGRRTPIVALTAHAMKGDKERLLAAGMDGYVAKPVRPELLLDEIARCTSKTEVPPAESESAADADSLIDLNTLMTELGGRDVVNELLSIAAPELSRLIDRMRGAHAEQHHDELGKFAHTMKGALGNLRASRSAAVAARLEACCREGVRQAIDLSFDELQHDVARVVDAATRLREDLVGREP